MSKLDALVSALLRAKEQKKTWADTVTGLENQIADAMNQGKDEGSVSVDTDTGYQVTTTFKLSRTIDKASYEAVKGKIPEGLSPIILKPSLDLKKLRAIETANPELAKLCNEFIVVKPAKASVLIKEVSK